MPEKKRVRFRPISVILACVLLLSTAAGGFLVGLHTGSQDEAIQTSGGSKTKESNVEIEVLHTSNDSKDSESTSQILETFQIPKTPMTHNGSFAFSWTTDKVFGARTLDYLIPQIPEIFITLGIETISKYVVEDDVAKYITFRSMLRCYNIIDKDKGRGIAVLVYLREDKETVFVSVQVINPLIIVFPDKHDGQNSFELADFNGDGQDKVFTKSLDIGADHYRFTLGVFPFDNGVWSAPLFWAGRGSVDHQLPGFFGMPYDFGFTLSGENEPFTIHNAHTGYSRELLPGTSEHYYNELLTQASITNTKIVDVDADGVYKLIVEQRPFRWNGKCITLLKYDSTNNSFETIYAEFVQNGDPEDNEYRLFLNRAGYNPDIAVFILPDKAVFE
jgi:hypothetical protein